MSESQLSSRVELHCKGCGKDKPGSEFYVYEYHGNRSTCKQCVNERQKRLRQQSGAAERLGNAWCYEKRRKLRLRAKNKGLPFDLTTEDIKRLYSVNICGYCLRDDQVISFDRVIPENGYTMANAFMACFDCNYLRNNKFTHEEMRQIGEILRVIYSRRRKNLQSK